MHTHSHGHDHHHHNHAVAVPNRAFLIGIGLNISYVITEVIFGLSNHSLVLLTDAGHNLGDVAGLVISLLAFKMAKVKANEAFTYGYKKTTILAALFNAVILLITIGILGYEAINRLQDPQPVPGGIIAWVAGMGIVVNGLSALLFFRDKDHELNSKGAYLHMMVDAIVSLGVVISGIVIVYTHWYWLDAAVSLVVVLVILKGTWSLLIDSFRLSMDGVPANVDINNIMTKAHGVAGVKGFHHLHIWAMSTTENALTAHLVVENNLDNLKLTEIKNNLKHALQHLNIQHITLETEFENDDCKPEC